MCAPILSFNCSSKLHQTSDHIFYSFLSFLNFNIFNLLICQIIEPRKLYTFIFFHWNVVQYYHRKFSTLGNWSKQIVHIIYCNTN